MKARVIYLIALIMIAFLANDAMAQRGRGYENRGARPYNQPGRLSDSAKARQDCAAGIENLSQEQLDKIRELQLKRQEQSIQHRTAMDELRARKRRLIMEQEPNMGEVNSMIDQMSASQAQWMKEITAHHQEIRKLLTDEQRIIYDSRIVNRPVMRQHYRHGQGGFQPNMGRGRW